MIYKVSLKAKAIEECELIKWTPHHAKVKLYGEIKYIQRGIIFEERSDALQWLLDQLDKQLDQMTNDLIDLQAHRNSLYKEFLNEQERLSKSITEPTGPSGQRNQA